MGHIDKEELAREYYNLIYGFMKTHNISYKKDEILDILYVGFTTALNTYEPERGAFTTHAYHCMMSQYMHYLDEENRIKRLTNKNVSSLNVLVNGEDDEWLEFIKDPSVDIEKEIITKMDMEKVNKIREKYLSEKENTIIQLYYLEGYRDGEIAQLLKMSKSRICHIRNKALNKLRYFCRDMRDY